MLDKLGKHDMIYSLGLVVTVGLFIYVVMKCMTLQMNVIEGAVGGRSKNTDDSNDSDKKSSNDPSK